MIQERLLERIANLEKKKDPDQPAHTVQQLNSIISHLTRLLNTRQGSVAIAPDFGVPDITNIPGNSIRDIRERIENIIEEVVRKYEPRLTNVKMIMQEDDRDNFSLRFRLEANLAEHDNIPVIFETVVSTEGRIIISS